MIHALVDKLRMEGKLAAQNGILDKHSEKIDQVVSSGIIDGFTEELLGYITSYVYKDICIYIDDFAEVCYRCEWRKLCLQVGPTMGVHRGLFQRFWV